MLNDLKYEVEDNATTNLELYNLVSRKIDTKYAAVKALRSIVPFMEFIKKE